MFKDIVQLLIEEGIEFIYTSRKALPLLEVPFCHPKVHIETVINEKVAYEFALSASIVKKRSCFITGTRELCEALDPIMSSAYMGVLGPLLIVAVRDQDHDFAFLGPFSKLPLIVEGRSEKFRDAISFGMYISEKFEIPVIVELDVLYLDKLCPISKTGSMVQTTGSFEFHKNPSRWAATPSFRYKLHKILNEKIKSIREEFENYQGNEIRLKGTTGFISYRQSALSFFFEDFSTLYLSTVHPLPLKLVSRFLEDVDEAFVLSDPHSVIEYQICDFKEKIKPFDYQNSIKKNIHGKAETIFGYEVVRDTLGPASSINMAHGIKKTNPERRILAITYEDHFFHSGIPAFINTLYNDSHYHLLILAKNRVSDLKVFMEGIGFKDYYTVEKLEDLKEYLTKDGLTVFIMEGSI
ncbi:MAG: hypothetical protein NZ583_00600 [Desulfobacterota bacterium]|nr:hypothetical protein [Thermodesulfobacteriota bacterium]MDW8001213.1 hypothetical protein [Deltaproteobacteria bacterium]